MPDRREAGAALAERLRGLVGSDRVFLGQEGVAEAEIAIHGMAAPLAVRPGDREQLAAVLAWANTERLGVCIAGGGTKINWGNRPERFDLLLSTRDLRSPCDVDADDLTMTVAAGVTVAEARARASAAGRVLPLDAGQPRWAAIGGVTATGDLGARAAGYGRVRDLTLGLKATLADGTPVKFGGRTMKNVAGYDVTKLFVGSFGVLGVITEVTFRLLPRPDTQGLMVLRLPSLDQGKALAAKILDSNLQPLVLEVISPALFVSLGDDFASRCPGGAEGLVFLAGFAGHPAALERSIADVSGWSGLPAGALLRDADAEWVLDALADHASRGITCLRARAVVPLSAVWGLARAAESLANAEDLLLSYRIGAARGVLDLWVGSQPALEADSKRTSWATGVRAAAIAAGGKLAVTEGLTLLSIDFDAWGDESPANRFAKRIKERFDPNRTLNPGRFVGGI